MGKISDSMQSVVDDIKSSAENRHVKLSEMNIDTHNLMKRFHMEHQDMANAQKEKLSSDEKTRMEAFKQLMDDVRADIQFKANALKEKLSSDGAARKDMASALEKKLSLDRITLRESVQQYMDELISDRSEVGRIWRQLFGNGGNGGENVEKPAAPGHIEETVKETVEEAAPSIAAPSIEDQMLEVIAKHPEGIKLVDIGNEMGVDWRGLNGAIKPLVDESKTEKIDNLYYPKS